MWETRTLQTPEHTHGKDTSPRDDEDKDSAGSWALGARDHWLGRAGG